ncbi:ribosomal protection-like ABC-F family protein [Streptomyces clavuligerus]|nr:ABC-F family ATP-binding cassette domain-containing protein [Streptomyces clavuligerus]ANW22207.1 ABC transporter ATP-binding protein [Streptomyces clavuligerus]MBY6307257.1 ABC-F family ATP-binding cassette domain-containing protein [Streptomyces clavuligerus]QPL67295.1 ABC-F family ATP-binding cassette domain-containing protein [Streptomyces clavuligerus]QPL73193.1 ABC-F family ATP-binding cassette domain-containing protein [Streptomyces clavuligerus]QPL79398.1 ABC-F family ATP-binding ca
MPTQITALAVTKSLGGRLVLDSVTCSLAAGERTGIIGENGSGKTTLLRLLSGCEQPDQGEIVVQADGGIGYFAQEGHLAPGATVREVIDGALSELRAIERRMRSLETRMADGDEAVMAEYGELMTVFELRGGYEADARVERALHGLGLGSLERDRAIGGLSGGQQVRLRLAAVLAASPEILLLDEPTNHLDESALDWLEDHLRTRRGTTVAVCHDRAFLERVATSLLEVDADRRTVVRYGNGYAGYLTEKAAARRRWTQEHTQWQDEVDRVREAAATTARRVAPGRAMKDGNKMAYDRAAGRVQQSLAGRVRQAEERLNRLLAAPVPPPPEPLRFAPVLRSGRLRQGAVLDATDVFVADRLHRTSVTVQAGDRLLITGANGAGKSTLLRVLAGEVAPDGGTVTRRGRIGYLPQQPRFDRPGETVSAAFARGRAGHPADHTERLLSLGLFNREQLSVRVGSLSTGQRQRLALARLLSEPWDVLLLDEPTNHVSLVLAEELETALAGYGGTLVIVSHDRRLARSWQGNRLALRTAAESALEPALESAF